MKRPLSVFFLTAGLALLAGGCGDTGDTGQNNVPVRECPMDGTLVARGTCEGRSGLSCSGHVSLYRTTSGQAQIRFESDFVIDDTPGSSVYINNQGDLGDSNGSFDPNAVEIGRLQYSRGCQQYNVPAGAEQNRMWVWTWFRPFGVEFSRTQLVPVL